MSHLRATLNAFMDNIKVPPFISIHPCKNLCYQNSYKLKFN